MFRHSLLRCACFGVALGVAAAPLMPARGQDRTTFERLDRLERDLNMLQRQVYRGGPAPLAGGDPGVAMNAEIRMDRIESQTLDGVGIIKLFFHPGANVERGLAQATAVSQAILRRMPPGVQPPIILRYAADSVPIIQMSLSSETLSESELYTYGIFRIRQQL